MPRPTPLENNNENYVVQKEANPVMPGSGGEYQINIFVKII